MRDRFDAAPCAGGSKSPLVRHLAQAIQLDSTETAALADLEQGRREVAANWTLIREGEAFDCAYVVRSGWAIRHKDLVDGRRQIVDFVLPGDILGVEANVVPAASESVTALTSLQVAPFEPDRITYLFARQPRLGCAIAWLAARDRAVLSERVVTVGRRSAYERTAHILLELWRRLGLRGLADERGFQMPVTQAVLADTLGLSVVHVNRSLRLLYRDGLIHKDRGTVTILDLDAMIRAAGFQSGYLNEVPLPERMLRTIQELRQPSG